MAGKLTFAQCFFNIKHCFREGIFQKISPTIVIIMYSNITHRLQYDCGKFSILFYLIISIVNMFGQKL